MRAFVVGATGTLGRRIVRQLAKRGHTVVGLARRPENDRVIRSLGGEPRTADPFDVASLARAAEGTDVVIHAATKIPVKARIRAADWAENDRIRREGIRALLAATARVGAQRYIQQSIVWLARPEDESEFDESSTFRNPDPVYQSMMEGETSVREASDDHGFAASILRFGFFYGADSAHIRQMGEGLARGKLPIIGEGRGIWRLIHLEDAANAFVTVAESPRSGLWHAVDDEPVAVRTFLTALAERLRAPKPRHVPRWIARIAVGNETASFFIASTRTGNARIRQDLGWVPSFPTYRQGLDEIVTTWRAEGFPRA